MITRKTIDQILQVLEITRNKYISGMPLHKSYPDAVRDIADRYSVTYQTIGDGCRRRLNLNDISELYLLLEEWLNGNPNNLIAQLKEQSGPNSHHGIDSFFNKFDSNEAPAGPILSKDDQTETFPFRLPLSEARLLRALSDIEGSSPPELIGKIMQQAVKQKMKDFAKQITN